MKVSVVPIGNSKGIRIPKAILQQCHIEEYVDIEVKNEHIVIKSSHEKIRKNWKQAFKKMHENNEDNLLINNIPDMEIEGWTW